MPWMMFRPMEAQSIELKLLLMELTMDGIAATIFGIEFRRPWTNAPISWTPEAMICGRLRMIALPIAVMSCPAVLMS